MESKVAYALSKRRKGDIVSELKSLKSSRVEDFYGPDLTPLVKLNADEIDSLVESYEDPELRDFLLIIWSLGNGDFKFMDEEMPEMLDYLPLEAIQKAMKTIKSLRPNWWEQIISFLQKKQINIGDMLYLTGKFRKRVDPELIDLNETAQEFLEEIKIAKSYSQRPAVTINLLKLSGMSDDEIVEFFQFVIQETGEWSFTDKFGLFRTLPDALKTETPKSYQLMKELYLKYEHSSDFGRGLY